MRSSHLAQGPSDAGSAIRSGVLNRMAILVRPHYLDWCSWRGASSKGDLCNNVMADAKRVE